MSPTLRDSSPCIVYDDEIFPHFEIFLCIIAQLSYKTTIVSKVTVVEMNLCGCECRLIVGNKMYLLPTEIITSQPAGRDSKVN